MKFLDKVKRLGNGRIPVRAGRRSYASSRRHYNITPDTSSPVFTRIDATESLRGFLYFQFRLYSGNKRKRLSFWRDHAALRYNSKSEKALFQPTTYINRLSSFLQRVVFRINRRRDNVVFFHSTRTEVRGGLCVSCDFIC